MKAKYNIVCCGLAIVVAAAVLGASEAAPASAASGTITVSAHRIRASYWDPCFAARCSAGTGPGATMYFEVYNSEGSLVRSGYADEHGHRFTGLNPWATYYVYPLDCDRCHGSNHNVVFRHWGDGTSDRPLAARTGESLAAWYSCTNGCAGG